MRSSRNRWIMPLSFAGILCLILDARSAVSGAQDGLYICARSIIPSLFPLIFLTKILNSGLTGSTKLFPKMEKTLHLPYGSGRIWALSCLSGYPVGSHLIGQKKKDCKISDFDANRILLFCNNPGPAFIFGVTGPLFSSLLAPLILWGILLLISLITGAVFPGSNNHTTAEDSGHTQSLSTYLTESICSVSSICGWIILFRTFLAVINRWLLQFLPTYLKVIIYGIFELANGCVELGNIHLEGIRFILCAAFLSFGGICVNLQTMSAMPSAKMDIYCLSKSFQCVLATILAYILQHIVFAEDQRINLPVWCFLPVIFIAFGSFGLLYRKIVVEKKKSMLYNQENKSIRGTHYAVPKENRKILQLLQIWH